LNLVAAAAARGTGIANQEATQLYKIDSQFPQD
jgi:hypothetical protein